MEELETVEEISDEVVEGGKTLKELLVEMKNLSEAMMDLAYSAVLLNSRTLAEEVLEMEDEMDKLKIEAEIKAMLASRNRKDAEDLTGILMVAHAAEDIADAAENIVDVVLRGEADHPILKSMLSEAEETTARVELSGDSVMVGKSLLDLKLATHTGMFVIAIKRDSKWVYRPSKNLVLGRGDVLIASGSKEGARILEKLAAGKLKRVC